MSGAERTECLHFSLVFWGSHSLAGEESVYESSWDLDGRWKAMGKLRQTGRWTGLNVHVVLLCFSPDVEHRGTERSLAAAVPQ